VAWDVLRPENRGQVAFRVGHPGGCLTAEARAVEKDGKTVIERLGVYRTARRIMDGQVYIRRQGWEER
jgi:2-methylaconitate cis-trans-isomerase PrpF